MNWIAALGFGILGAIVITAFGYIYLVQTTNNYKAQIETSTQQLAAQNLTAVQNEVKEISNNLNLAAEVLSKQILFSELLQQLATLMPANTTLSTLAISQTQGAIDITATAKNYEAATQVHINLTDANNQLFSKADLVSISCSGTTRYPCTVQVRALFSQNNPYMLIHNKAKS